jgi:hypothetical protein
MALAVITPKPNDLRMSSGAYQGVVALADVDLPTLVWYLLVVGDAKLGEAMDDCVEAAVRLCPILVIMWLERANSS